MYDKSIHITFTLWSKLIFSEFYRFKLQSTLKSHRRNIPPSAQMETTPSQTPSSLQQEEEDKHHLGHDRSHVHIHNHLEHEAHNYTHLHNQLQDHLTDGVSKQLCPCQLEELLLEEMEEAKHEKLKAKIEERKKERKALNEVVEELKPNFDVEEALLFIEGDKKITNPPSLKRGAKCGEKKKRPCKIMQRTVIINNSDNTDSGDESLEEANLCAGEEDQDHVQHCQDDQTEGFDWTEVNMRKKKRTSRKPDSAPLLFTIEDLSHTVHNVCHENPLKPVANPSEKKTSAKVWEACLFPGEEPSKVLSEEDFPSLQTCGSRRKTGVSGPPCKKSRASSEHHSEVLDGKVKVVEEEEDELNGQEEKDEVKEDVGQEELLEKRNCEQLTRSCLRDMFQFPGTVCFCFCDSGKISTVSNSVEEVEDPKVGMSRVHAMLGGLPVPFGQF